MRTVIITALLIAAGCAGCAGQPTSPPPPATPPTTVVARTLEGVPAKQMTTNGAAIDPEVVLDAKRRGYTVVNENGETLYCRQAARTGSHVAGDVSCLTEKDMALLREQSLRGLQNNELQMRPAQGH
jgi:hypothetical protein